MQGASISAHWALLVLCLQSVLLFDETFGVCVSSVFCDAQCLNQRLAGQHCHSPSAHATNTQNYTGTSHKSDARHPHLQQNLAHVGDGGPESGPLSIVGYPPSVSIQQRQRLTRWKMRRIFHVGGGVAVAFVLLGQRLETTAVRSKTQPDGGGMDDVEGSKDRDGIYFGIQ